MLVITENGQTDVSSAEIMHAIKEGWLRDLLPSKANIPFEFSTGEKNSFDVARDRNRTYLILHNCMETPFAVVSTKADKGGYQTSYMRRHIRRLFEQLPEEFCMLAVTIKIRQAVDGEEITFKDKAFLLSVTQVFGEGPSEETDCEDEQLDIFATPQNRLKTSSMGSFSTSWWWLRTPRDSENTFYYVGINGRGAGNFGEEKGGVVFGICIEDRSHEDQPEHNAFSDDTAAQIEQDAHKKVLSGREKRFLEISFLFAWILSGIILYNYIGVACIFLWFLITFCMAFMYVFSDHNSDPEDTAAAPEEQNYSQEKKQEQNSLKTKDAQYISEIRKFREEIKDGDISDQLEQMEGTLERIVRKAENDPSAEDDARRLMEYYLPTIIKLLQAYIEIEDNPRKGANASKIMEETDESLKTLNQTMETILDNMYLGTEQDLSSDIAAMKSMMLQDGAKGEFTGLQVGAQAEDEKVAQQNTNR